MKFPSRSFLTRLSLAALLSGAAGAQAAEPLRIGVPVGLSGANSVVAPGVVQASQLAADEINAAGGILGRRIELEIADDASGAVGAQKAYDTLVFQKKVDAVIAMETSAARNAALPIIARGKVPYLYTSFYEGRSCNRWMHVNGWVPEQQVAPVVDHFMKTRQAKTFFLIGSDYAFGRGMLKFTREYIEKQGGKVVGEEYLPIDGSDWTAVVSKVRSAQPDALISSTAGGSPNVSLAKQIQAAGLTMPYGNLAIDEGTAKTMGDTAAGMYLSSSYLTSIHTPQNRKFLDGLKAKFAGQAKTANEFSAAQYEGFFLYKAAVEKAGGTTDPAKVVQALSEVSVDGPRGPVRMDRQRHAALTMRLGQVQQDGSIRILQTFDQVDPGAQCPDLK
ncbi:Aliphatic amidase expression-regulating protein [Achromobacter denitrificans]|uniref:substrate-binding protein n=1 Tax=Achromobacter denitrificans TaxID=32002 RepID=UPI0007880199|nr:substrate-binding protein [Achromobacter denitrificans]OLU07561.1 amino acid ABC transporter [Achromobacter denitrificans]QKH41519.1 substrate-binding protein [Achromobacter denitrificans]QKH51338.1 substrate-binding protein [Achromobacter denitrificans]CAB3726075.1 Aliphatic amidase expression-regulating protein [Achromobacter denitrificans]SUU26160.1 Aliphatic amidase expression-regulating protein [Achromobacter denitrificans]